jgi:hypothetical protein
MAADATTSWPPASPVFTCTNWARTGDSGNYYTPIDTIAEVSVNSGNARALWQWFDFHQSDHEERDQPIPRLRI